MTDECCAEGVGRMLRSRAKPSERLRRLRKKLLDGSLNNLLSRTGGPSQAVLEILRRNLNDARPIQRRAGEKDSPGHAHLRGDRGVSRPRLLLDEYRVWSNLLEDRMELDEKFLHSKRDVGRLPKPALLLGLEKTAGHKLATSVEADEEGSPAEGSEAGVNSKNAHAFRPSRRSRPAST